MIDVLLRFNTEAAARTALARFVATDAGGALQWDASQTVSGVQVWRPSADTTAAVTVDGQPQQVVTHTYLPGFYLWVSLPAVPPEILALTQIQFAYDRDKLNARQAGAIVKSTVSAAVLNDIAASPVLMGSNPPIGTLGQYL